jgi:hypothetical protein
VRVGGSTSRTTLLLPPGPANKLRSSSSSAEYGKFFTSRVVALRATEALAAALPEAAAAASRADTLMPPSESAALVCEMTWHAETAVSQQQAVRNKAGVCDGKSTVWRTQWPICTYKL